MRIIAIMGKAGSGKSTVAHIVAEALGFGHISTGELARRGISGDWLELGMMSPEKEIRALFEDAINDMREQCLEGVIVDGMPRKPSQVRYMYNLFANDSIIWINLDISDDGSIKRLLERRRVDDTDEAIFNRIAAYNLNYSSIANNITKNRGVIHNIDANRDFELVVASVIDKL